MTVCPGHLDLVHRRAIADEVASAYGHALRNAVGPIGNAAYRVRRRLENIGALAADPALERSLALIERRVASAAPPHEGFLDPPLEEPPPSALRAVLDALLGGLDLPRSIEVTVDAADCDLVRGDALELGLALFCHVENAADALETSGGGRLLLRCARHGDRVAIAVVDDGPGLTAAPEQCLERFFTTKPGRLGLGLSLARRLAARAGGTLALTASAGGGAEATLTVYAAARAEQASASRAVLLVDDDEASRLTLGGLLEDLGLEVIEARTLAEARARLAERPFALILIDIYLRGECGTDLLPEIRATQPRARVIAVTGSATATPPGLDHVLVKGGAPAEMLAAIERLLAVGGDAPP